MNQITLLGPLSVELDFKVNNGAILAGDAHIAKHRGIIFGGPMLRMTRLLRSIGHIPLLCSYVGNDEFGEKIIELIKDEGIEANIQKISNIVTPLFCKLMDKKDYTYYITETKQLDMWKFRVQGLQDHGIVFIDPSLSTQIHIELIKQFKNSIIVIRKPLDKSLDVFNVSKKLIVLLNEYEVFQIYANFRKGYFYPEAVLELELLENHSVLVESKENLSTKNEDGKIMNLPLGKLRHNYAMMDDFFVTGLLAGLAANQTTTNAFLWGLTCSIQNGKNEQIKQLDVLAKALSFTWIESLANELIEEK